MAHVELFFQIVRRGTLEEFKELIDNANVNVRNEQGQSLLHESIAFDRDDFSEFLLSLGIDVNHQDKNGQTPLHFASCYSNKVIVDLLFNAGANPRLKDKYGNSPLWTAIFNAKDDYSVVQLFKKQGADFLSKNKVGKSPLDLAKRIGNSELLKLLTEL
jgi:ankyrin repeat protein